MAVIVAGASLTSIACLGAARSSATVEELCGNPSEGAEREDWLPSPPLLPPPIPDVIPALPPASADDNPYRPAAGVASVSARTGHALLAIDPQRYPDRISVPQACLEDGKEYVAVIRICVSERGEVYSVQSLRRSVPWVDDQLAAVVSGWRYRPYYFDGRLSAFCYPMRYVVRR